MKNALIFLLCTLLCVQLLYSQSLGLGVKAGLNIPMALVDDEEFQESFAPTIGGHIGAHGYYMFSKNVGIEAGLGLTQLGYSIEVEDNEWEGISLNYFAIPLSLRLKWGYFTLNPGLQPSFLMSAKFVDEDVTDQFSNTDVLFFVTPGMEFPMGLTLGSTFSIGTVNIFESDGVIAKNFAIQFSVGYNFIRPKD